MGLLRVTVPCLLATAGLSAACGSLRGDTVSLNTLATMRGEIDNPSQSLQISGNLRVAVVWLQTGGHVSVSEDLPVQPVFPSQFVVDLKGPPPAGAMINPADNVSDYTGPSDFRFAYGAIVAYDDRNDNGALDLVPDDAGMFIDRVVATNPYQAVVYFQGTLPTATAKVAHGAFKLGYSILEPDCANPDAGPPDGGDCDWATFVDIGSPYNLTVSSDPLVNQIMCQTYAQHGSVSSWGTGSIWNVNPQGTPPGGYPPPDAQGLTCTNAGSLYASYELVQCQTVADPLCNPQKVCTLRMVQLAGAAVPAGWPCPLVDILDAGSKG
jgi:hypothetical protein